MIRLLVLLVLAAPSFATNDFVSGAFPVTATSDSAVRSFDGIYSDHGVPLKNVDIVVTMSNGATFTAKTGPMGDYRIPVPTTGTTGTTGEAVTKPNDGSGIPGSPIPVFTEEGYWNLERTTVSAWVDYYAFAESKQDPTDGVRLSSSVRISDETTGEEGEQFTSPGKTEHLLSGNGISFGVAVSALRGSPMATANHLGVRGFGSGLGESIQICCFVFVPKYGSISSGVKPRCLATFSGWNSAWAYTEMLGPDAKATSWDSCSMKSSNASASIWPGKPMSDRISASGQLGPFLFRSGTEFQVVCFGQIQCRAVVSGNAGMYGMAWSWAGISAECSGSAVTYNGPF